MKATTSQSSSPDVPHRYDPLVARVDGLMLKIHEQWGPSGELESVCLRVAEGGTEALEIVEPSGALPLPPGALEKVMARYGAPFDAEARFTIVAELDLGLGQKLKQVRHLAGYDVIARDYLVLELEPGGALCALSTTVAGALRHLARARRDTPG